MRLKLQQSYASIKKGGSFTRVYGIALACFAALGAAFLVNQAPAKTPMLAEETGVTEAVELDFSSETQADENKLSFTLTSSSLTDTSNAFKVSARASTIETVISDNRHAAIYLTVEDSDWIDYSTAVENGQAAIAAAQESQTEYVPAEYDAYVFCIQNTRRSQTDLVIPEDASFSSTSIIINGVEETVYAFKLNIIGIHAEACYSWSSAGVKGEEPSYTNVTSITIPNTVTYVEDGAFNGSAASGVTFNVEHTEDVVDSLDTWSSEWVEEGTTVNYGVAYDHSETTYSAHTVGNLNRSKRFGQAADYCIGSYTSVAGHEDYYQPMYVEYTVVDEEGAVVPGYENLVLEQPLSNSNTTVDAIGSKVGASTLSFNLDFEVPTGCHVDPESIIFHNIYNAVNADVGGASIPVPVVEDGAFYARPIVGFSAMYDIDDLFEFVPRDIPTFGDYIAFSIKVNTKNLSAYEKICPDKYETNKTGILNGTYTIRILFDSLTNASYHVVYEKDGADVESVISVSTPISYTLIENGDVVNFMIRQSEIGDGFSFDSLKEVYFEGFNIKIDLFDYAVSRSLTNSSRTIRFGSLAMMPNGKVGINNVNLVTIMLVVYAIFFVISIAAAIVLYFYKKNKYKNDEFRRMNKRNYISRAWKNILGLFLILSSIMFIIFRWGFLNPSVVVYNPLDVWVIIFTVAGVIALGLFIKDFVVGVKLSREVKRKKRLHLDEDVVDDGTK